MKKIMYYLGSIFLTVNTASVISCGTKPDEIIEKYNLKKLELEIFEDQNQDAIETKILFEAKKFSLDASITDFLIVIEQDDQLFELTSEYTSKKDDIVIIMPSYETKLFTGIKEVKVNPKKDERIDISEFDGEDIFVKISPATRYEEIQTLAIDYLSTNIDSFSADDIVINVNENSINNSNYEEELVDKDIISIVSVPNSENIKGEISFIFNFEKILIPSSKINITINVGDNMEEIKENVKSVLINYLLINYNIETRIKYLYDWKFEAIVRDSKEIEVSEYDSYIAQEKDFISIRSVYDSKIIDLTSSIFVEVK
ncbi:hypothetical protein [Spiroplasma culicicola]|uniref:Lipoprotein n=1 Tax=Spiroplasma culicicola AES-1 TaxID=1276246 RepID=W6AI17_9MOLU|nr:hypothetical protein [Spiroplasma culicicola]AHI53344.1 hypothetical protein SCULI_v1c10040 [Spiroplasma culicicola AES-1]